MLTKTLANAKSHENNVFVHIQSENLLILTVQNSSTLEKSSNKID